MQRLKEQGNQFDDEIDLRLVVNKIGNGFNTLFRKISYVFRVIRMNILLMLLFLALGLGAGYGLYSITKPFYTSSMTLMLANIRNDFIEEQFNKLSEMIAEKNSEALAARLSISAEEARQLKEMGFANVELARLQEDSILTTFPIRIELSLYDRQLFDTMETALVNYLQQNKYFIRQKRIKQQELDNMISKLRSEIASIDSMKTNISEPRGPVNGFVYGQPIDPTNLYKESVSMYKELVKLESERERLNNVQVVSGFVPKLRPTGPSLRKYMGIGGLISLFIGTVVLLMIDSRKRRSTEVQ